jgi:hypothetical protein
VLCVVLPSAARANGFEVFAKGSVSKNYIANDEWEVSVSGSTGLAIVLIPQIRIEGRYANISSLQNKLVAAASSTALTITDMKTTTSVYSVGIDLDILGDRHAFQPFLYVGAGYLDTERSYYVQASSDPSTVAFIQEPHNRGISGNLGAGFRIAIARTIAFEVEAFAYALDLKDPNPLINWTGTVGVRLFI